MSKVHIIIVKYKDLGYLKDCVNSVIENTDVPYHLTVHDNYPQNEFLAPLWNRLVSQKDDCEYVCLLNDDTKVGSGWLKKMIEVFQNEENVGAVGPTTNNCKNHQCQELPTEGYRIVDYGNMYSGWCLSGFCLVIRKKVWDEVGGMPSEFDKLLYGQEVAFLDKMMKLGYRQIWRKDAFVWHKGSATVKELVSEGYWNEDEERKKAREAFTKLRNKVDED
jgi:GT2 family glycosyltransferase